MANTVKLQHDDSMASADLIPRVLVSTDIGGTDYDDFQSMVHLLVYADRFDIEGLLSSPMGGPGRQESILHVIDEYEKDYANLRTYSERYPTASALRAITRQGATASAGIDGWSQPTAASKLIVERARHPDERPLWLLMWGGLEDLAQALHDDPSIKRKLRVYWVGGPNKKWSARAYDYIARHHKELWIIETNTTYYGWFIGGDQEGDLGNLEFVSKHMRGRGTLGTFFAEGISFRYQTRVNLKMGDTPSVAYLLGETHDDPTKDSWGGRFVRAWDRRRTVFDRMPTEADAVEACSIIEIRCRPAARSPAGTTAAIVVNDQAFAGYPDQDGVWSFIYCPKQPELLNFTIRSTDARLDGQAGAFNVMSPEPGQPIALDYPNWWTDDPSPEFAEKHLQGAKTISRWRKAYLSDFAERMERCGQPAKSH